jgi:hypothetical protein
MARQIESKLTYIRRKLNDKAYSNAEVSRITKVTNSHLSNIASGLVKNPSYDMVDKIYLYFKGLK